MELDDTYIKAYLRGTLSPTETQTVNARLEAEPVFAQAVAETRLLMEVAELSLRVRMKAEAQAARARAEARPRWRLRGRWLWVVASIALVGVGIFLATRRSIGEEIFQQYITQPAYDGPTSGQRAVDKAYTLYHQQQFHKALGAFRTFPVGSADADTAQFYIGISLLLMDSTDGAIAELEQFACRHCLTDTLPLSVKNPVDFAFDIYCYETRWYEGLGLLRVGRSEEAKLELTRLLKNGGTHQQEISEILKRLQ